uniref:Protein translocase subunit SecA n=1 Tax=Phaeophyceae sp. TaxID=2249243 RepID=A0A8E5BHW2_9PHAE|nr:preprotein translocase subunit A [Phaeophyceae sp.]
MRIFPQRKTIRDEYSLNLNFINTIENELIVLSDQELKSRALRLKYFSKKTIDSNNKVLAESFALSREASKRTIGLRHYDIQLIGGLILNEGKIAEMKTGEGKTLVSTSPAVFNSLVGTGVHIITINNYLAKRDATWVGPSHRLLGLNVGLISSNLTNKERKNNYSRDIVYVTNTDLVFDFLRDNLITNIKEVVQKPFNFCIIDEIDSVLIDEARTPLIISRESDLIVDQYFKANEVSKYLIEKKHFKINKKNKIISLTEKGFIFLKILLNVNDLFNIENPWITFILNSLKARYFFILNIHYILNNNNIILIDEFTGRILEGRKWNDGLHQALEAKENIPILKGTETLSSITYQNFFRLYPKISGMTGTAKTEELEFENIYGLSVLSLPTYKTVKRQDKFDIFYIDQISKWRAVAQECLKMYLKGQPVLVGTTTIQNSEILSLFLKIYNIPHKLLNAKPKNIIKEANIIAQAGCFTSITIATNMAGRGTDILLGGNPEFKALEATKYLLKKLVFKENFFIVDISLTKLQRAFKKNYNLNLYLERNLETLLLYSNLSANKKLNTLETLIFCLYNKLLKRYKMTYKDEAVLVKSLGGLYVIGTERHESRRIDNQLKGRSGRQGNPGVSQFFLSLDDPLFTTFGGNSTKNLMEKFRIKKNFLDSEYVSKSLSKSLNFAQKNVEEFFYEQRKILNKYDQVLNKQRKIIYNLRKKVLYTTTLHDLVIEFSEGFLDDFISYLDFKKNKDTNIHVSKQILKLLNRLSISSQILYNNIDNLPKLKKFIYEQLWISYASKKFHFLCSSKLYSQILTRYIRLIFFKYIDLYWYKHLENMEFLFDATSWDGYAQRDPFFLYEESALILFTNAIKDCRNSIVFDIFISSFN